MRVTRMLLVALSLLVVAGQAHAGIDARLLRYPDVSASSIAFVYAGDIWIVPKEGGTARRLSSPPGEELFPRFSPDGSRIAFSGNYDGNVDIYVMPVTGGVPHRVTYHPDDDLVLDWSPDGTEILFASPRADERLGRTDQLYRVPVNGGLPVKLPVPYGAFGTLSPDGGTLAYTTRSRIFRNWKRYRGGTAPDIWLFDLRSREARNITASDANEELPMWRGKTIYFLSDRDEYQRANLWAYDTTTGASRELTHFTDADITFPAIGPDDIVFQAGGSLYRMGLEDERAVTVPVEVVTDLSTLKPRSENVSRLIAGADVSPSGKRAVFEARGDLFTVPEEHGPVLQLTRTSGVAERYPSWSPDGKELAYWSDASGEYELTVRPADAPGAGTTLTALGPGWRYRAFWSPDGARLAFIDNRGVIRVLDRASGALAIVDQDPDLLHPQCEAFTVSWSGDSRWLAYAKNLETGNSAVYVFDTRDGVSHRVTAGYYNDREPSFDPDGKYLYYLSSRNLEPVYSDLDATWVYPNSTVILAAPLRNDVASPLAPRNDVEKDEKAGKGEGESADSKDAGPDKSGKKGAKSADKVEPTEVRVDFDGLEARAVALPPAAGNYRGLRGVKGKVLYQRLPRSGAADTDRPVAFWDLEEREEQTIVPNASAFELSGDGTKLLVADKGAYFIVKVAPKQKLEKRLATAELSTILDPGAEWRQLFNDVWRAYRDFFYDPNLHGLDWSAMKAQYGALLGDAVTRWDVNAVIGELIAEVSASHTYVRGGDTERAPRRPVGLLGVDWAVDKGAYRVAHIVRGGTWDLDVRSPLDEPGVGVKEGDYVLAVNGVPVSVAKDPYAAFEGLANETVVLTVNGTPAREGARDVLVKTLDDESLLRNREWVEANRRKVADATGGRIGYVYVPNTAVPGQTELVRQLTSQVRLEGLIIDERFNAGGQLPDRFIEQVNRRLVTRIAFRSGAVSTVPSETIYGPKVMIINGWAGSGGDAFPFFFKELGVGPVVGERTWGGLIGPAVGHSLIDGGRYTVPPGRLYGADGKWFAEGHGVDPDIPVVDDPGLMARGRDPQLAAAVEEALKLLEEDPPHLPPPPPFEKRLAPAAAGATQGGR